jgi:hypothetical protein
MDEMTAHLREANHQAQPDDKLGRPAGKLTTLRIRGVQSSAEFVLKCNIETD